MIKNNNMKNYKLFLEQQSTAWTQTDIQFYTALEQIYDLTSRMPSNIDDYYSQLDQQLNNITAAMTVGLSPEAQQMVKEPSNFQKLNDLFNQTYSNSYQIDANKFQTIKDKLNSTWSTLGTTFGSTQGTATAGAPAAGGGVATPAVAAATPAVAAATPAVAQAASGGGTPAATAQGVNKTALFQKYMGSYDPNSSMDKSKMGLVDQALETFKKENKTDFTGSAEDITKMNKIMNDVYQSKEYASVVKGKGAATTDASKTTGQPTVKFGKQDMPTFIQVANGKFIPATEKDVQAGNQIWMKNPRKGQGESQKPNYVQVRTEKGNSLRPKSQLPGALGSVSNLLGDIGRTLDKTSRTPRTKPKK